MTARCPSYMLHLGPVFFGTSEQFYGAQEGLAHINSLRCSGAESRLMDCEKSTIFTQTGCSSSQGGYAYLFCRGERTITEPMKLCTHCTNEVVTLQIKLAMTIR